MTRMTIILALSPSAFGISQGLPSAVVAGLLVKVLLKPRGIIRSVQWLAVRAREATRGLTDRLTRVLLSRLERKVLARAKELGVDVPVRQSGGSPTIVLYYPSGATSDFYHDHGSYQSGLERGLSDPTRSFPRRPPPVVEEWSVDQLEAWLASHPPSSSN